MTTSSVLPMDQASGAASPPPQPRTIEDLGVEIDLLGQLLIKTLYTGEATGHTLAGHLSVSFALLEPIVEHARAEHLIEVRGTNGSGAAAYRYALTDLGRDRARQYLDMNAYVGPVPVPLSAYVAAMHSLSATRGYVDRQRLQEGFRELVISDAMIEQLGPALNSGTAIFLYGPPGNGKTVIAEGLGQTIGGEMYMPYALAIDGQIITMYDPISHQSLETPEPHVSVIDAGARDRRWVRIRRPVVIAGGELTLDMLDLTFNPLAKFYDAPVQLKANGGVFLVDDFGRQRARPQELLNRWIVPLESRVDYLTLHTGKKFQVPFNVLVVFATNLDPSQLADEAFLRRIPYKIAVTDPTIEQFTRIFELNCQRRNMAFHEVLVAYLERRHYAPAGRPLRACHPRDLLDQVTALCRFRGADPVITRELLDAACASYFVGEAGAAPADHSLPDLAARLNHQ
jgi:hypothetical protein